MNLIDLDLLIPLLKKFAAQRLLFVVPQIIILVLFIKSKKLMFRLIVLVLGAYTVYFFSAYLYLLYGMNKYLSDNMLLTLLSFNTAIFDLFLLIIGIFFFRASFISSFSTEKVFSKELFVYCKNYTLLAIIIYLFLYMLFGSYAVENTQFKNLSIHFLPTLIYLLNVILLAPIAEEFIYRGILWKRLDQEGNAYASIVSSVMWMLIHTSIYSWPVKFVLGYYLARIYKKTDSIYSPIIFHMYTNAFLLLFGIIL